ncbi:branched-chain amino acid ABC transporter permease [Rhodococcus fascians]|nr:branched-chain amino acid ABC transporter permease [Rhodococcus fascians]MBY4238354.1 branched-chain amino acid ABC transporter permease [Rhodococcus fascians]MBY4254265.1 branched-chain amino acid ABC transporter permease [Rhodococcus fascians]MBY4269646.1 branched-chain amino acid ABC transporter permease [Rhodococcus fascians]
MTSDLAENVAAASVPQSRASRNGDRFKRAVALVLAYGVPILIALAYFLPLMIDSRLRLQILTVAFINAAVVAGLVLSLGYTGLLNLSQATFYGLGAYTTAILVTDHNFSFWLAMLCAMLVAAAAGLVLALASARVKGDYFVLVSLATTIAVAQLLANLPSLTRGREGFFGLPEMSLAGLSFDNPQHTYYICLGLLTIVYAFVHRVAKSFIGRAMLVVRYDDVAARSMGIHPLGIRTLSLILSSGIAGLCGAILVGTVQFIRPTDFDFNPSFTFSLYVIIGGMASLPGAVVVAVVFSLLNEQFSALSDYRVGLVGAVVLVAVFWRGGVIKDFLRLKLHAGRRRRRSRNA